MTTRRRDLDQSWINPTPDNAAHVMAKLRAFGAPLMDVTVEALLKPGTVFQIGVVPCRVDILTAISGVAFSDAWKRRLVLEIEGRRAASARAAAPLCSEEPAKAHSPPKIESFRRSRRPRRKCGGPIPARDSSSG